MIFTTEERLAQMRAKRMKDSEQNITGASEKEFTAASTGSDKEKNVYTSTDSSSPEELIGQPFIMTFTEGWIRDYSVSFVGHIVECLGGGSYRVELTNKGLISSSIGRCQKEAEQSVLSEETPKSDEQAK